MCHGILSKPAARSGRRAEVAESFLADSDAHDGPVLLTVPPLPAEPIASSVRSFPVWLTAAPSAELDWYVNRSQPQRSTNYHAFRTAHFASMPAESGTSRTARCSAAAFHREWILPRRTGSIRTRSPRPRVWTPNGMAVSAGNAGVLGADYLAAIIARVNAYRWMAGLPGGVTLDPTENANGQQAALMMAANDELSHTPSPDWLDYSSPGADAPHIPI